MNTFAVFVLFCWLILFVAWRWSIRLEVASSYFYPSLPAVWVQSNSRGILCAYHQTVKVYVGLFFKTLHFTSFYITLKLLGHSKGIALFNGFRFKTFLDSVPPSALLISHVYFMRIQGWSMLTLSGRGVLEYLLVAAELY